VGTGIPTLVIATEADPTTPFVSGHKVFSQLDDGYLINITGGVHVMFGRGLACLDEAVADFIVQGTPGRVACDASLIAGYVRLVPDLLDRHANIDILRGVDDEFYYLPARITWDESEDLPVGCNTGGSVTFITTDTGTRYELEECGLTEALRISGTGTWDYVNGSSDLAVSIDGECAYEFHQDWGTGEESFAENCP
jgi:hypothetical protein